MTTSLLVMAAGIGTRFGGGIKQLEPVGLHDEIIIDYSVHDAIAAGFNKIIFVIRRDIEQDFRDRIGDRIDALCAGLGVQTHYVFQDLAAIPAGFPIPEGRIRPWGTGQAVLAARELLREPFLVINADDYYGQNTYRILHDWLIREHRPDEIAMAGFVLKNTLSDHGGVTRGLCRTNESRTRIVSVTETRNIVKAPDGARVNDTALDPDSFVSMNMWGFPAAEGGVPPFLAVLEEHFRRFFEVWVPNNPLGAEYLLPMLIGGMLRRGECEVTVLPTDDQWFGMTYRDDIPWVVENFHRLIEAGVYREFLYSDL